MTSKVVALQAWCKKQCQGYKNVEITNMTTSWRNGLAFCAIIHRYHPELIDFDSLEKDNIYENNKLAFDTGAKLGISPFLDPEDMVALKVPDRLSILTYVSQFYNVFGKQKPRQLGTSLKRVADDFPNVKFDENKKKRSQLVSKGNTNEIRTNVSSEDSCHICKSKVFLIERHFDSNHLYHRTCFRKLETSQIENGIKIDPYPDNELSLNTAECHASEASVKRNSQNKENTNLNSGKYVNLTIKKDVTDIERTSHEGKILGKETRVYEILDECNKSTNYALKFPENKENSGNLNVSRSSEIILKSNYQTAKDSATTMPSTISYSDTCLAHNKELENKISKVLQKDYSQEKSNEKINIEQPKDKNFNNKSCGSCELLSTDILSSTGSDSTLMPLRSVIDLLEEGDSCGYIPHISSALDCLNKNEKGESAYFQNAPVPSIVSQLQTFSADGDICSSTLISKSNEMNDQKNKIGYRANVSSVSRPTSNAPIYFLTTTSLVSRMSTYFNKMALHVKDTPEILPNVPPRSSLFYDFSNLKDSVPENMGNGYYEDPKNFHIVRNNVNSSPVPKPRKAHAGISGTIGRSHKKSSEANSPISHEVSSLSPVPQVEYPLNSPTQHIVPPHSHQRSSATSKNNFACLDDKPSCMDKKFTPVKPPRRNISGPEKSFTSENNTAQNASKSYKPYQITCSSTIPTNSHPLVSMPKQPPPRPSNPPCKKKILPKSKFHFESISSDDLASECLFATTASKDDHEKTEMCKKLQLIDKSLKIIEEEGRILEQTIRNGVDSFSDENMARWFDVVNLRNELVREETDLLYRWHQLELEKDQALTDAQLRALMSIPSNERTVAQKFKEDQLIKKLLKIVEKRSNIVDNQEDDRIRYLKEDEALRNTRELSLGEKYKTMKK